jgi:hypothetical protein
MGNTYCTFAQGDVYCFRFEDMYVIYTNLGATIYERTPRDAVKRLQLLRNQGKSIPTRAIADIAAEILDQLELEL